MPALTEETMSDKSDMVTLKEAKLSNKVEMDVIKEVGIQYVVNTPKLR